jgi:hypothetical protein
MDYNMSVELPRSFSDVIRRRDFTAIIVDWSFGREINPRLAHRWADAIADAYYPEEPLPRLPDLRVGYGYFVPRWVMRPRPEVLPDLGSEARIQRLDREFAVAAAKGSLR